MPNNEGYISNVNTVRYFATPFQRYDAGYVKIDTAGNLLELKTYTDTSQNEEYFYHCDIATDGDILLAGQRIPFIFIGNPNYMSGLILKLDSTGALQWSKTYRTPDNKYTAIKSAEFLNNGNILAVGYNDRNAANGQYTYIKRSPLFMLLDSTGNILYQLYETNRYRGVGYIKPDVNGGYFYGGSLDTFITNNPANIQNQPQFIAHLDDSFRITWEHSFADINGKRGTYNFKQTRDSGYIVVGSSLKTNDTLLTGGWAARFNKHGQMLWEQTYYTDYTQGDCWLINAAEQDDGGFIFCGMARTQATIQYFQQVWLVRVDSMGCPSMQCQFPTKAEVLPPLAKGQELQVYPNPTTGQFTLRSSAAGVFSLYDLQGREVYRRTVAAGDTPLQLPPTITPGVYVGRLGSEVIRIVYQP